jgi:mannosyltransferase OCH1-like enzyme
MDRLYTYQEFKTLQKQKSLNYSGVIPKLFLRTTPYLLNKLPSKLMDIYLKLLNENPDYIMCYFDNDDCINFIKDYFNYDNKYLNAYNTLIPTAYKCDLWRLLVLYTYGGIYNDAGHSYLVLLNSLLNDTDEFILVQEHTINIGIQNSFIITKPNNPIIIYIADYIIDYRIIPHNKGVCPLDVTGPIITGSALKSYYNDHVDTSKLYIDRPCSPNSRIRIGRSPFKIGKGNHIINNIKLKVFKFIRDYKNDTDKNIITNENDNNIITDEYDRIIIKTKFTGFYSFIYDTVNIRYDKLWHNNTIYF